MKYTFLQDIGGREKQEDSVSIFKLNKQIFMIVADGMGGHAGGEVASSTLLRISEDRFLLKNKETEEPYTFFSNIVEETKEELKYFTEHENLDPNTTVIFTLIKDNNLYYAYIGDSRLYLFEEKKKLIFRTRDDSLPELLFKNKKIQEHEISTHPQQNILTKSIGWDSTDSISFGEYKLNKYKKYRILLASDGLWAKIKENEIYNELFSSNSIELTVKKLLAISKHRGGVNGDNISLAILEVEKRTFHIKHFLSILVIIASTVSLFFYFFTSEQVPLNSSEVEKNSSIPININDNWSTG